MPITVVYPWGGFFWQGGQKEVQQPANLNPKVMHHCAALRLQRSSHHHLRHRRGPFFFFDHFSCFLRLHRKCRKCLLPDNQEKRFQGVHPPVHVRAASGRPRGPGCGSPSCSQPNLGDSSLYITATVRPHDTGVITKRGLRL